MRSDRLQSALLLGLSAIVLIGGSAWWFYGRRDRRAQGFRGSEYSGMDHGPPVPLPDSFRNRSPEPGGSSASWAGPVWNVDGPAGFAERYSRTFLRRGDETPVPFPGSVGLADKPVFVDAGAPDGNFKQGPSWVGSAPEPFSFSGQIVATAQEWEELWRLLGRRDPAPAVDFSKDMAIAVFATSNAAGGRVEILSVAEEGGKLSVFYRTAGDGRAGNSYEIVLVPRSRLPPKFEMVR